MTETLKQQLIAAGFAVAKDVLEPHILHAIPKQKLGAQWVTITVGPECATLSSGLGHHADVEWDQVACEARKVSIKK